MTIRLHICSKWNQSNSWHAPGFNRKIIDDPVFGYKPVIENGLHTSPLKFNQHTDKLCNDITKIMIRCAKLFPEARLNTIECFGVPEAKLNTIECFGLNNRGKTKHYRVFWSKDLEDLKRKRDAHRNTAEQIGRTKDIQAWRRQSAVLRQAILLAERTTFDNLEMKNRIGAVSHGHQVLFYADDLVLWYSAPKKNSQEWTESALSCALKLLANWCDKNGMVINNAKTAFQTYTLARHSINPLLRIANTTQEQFAHEPLRQSMLTTLQILVFIDESYRENKAKISGGAYSELISFYASAELNRSAFEGKLKTIKRALLNK
ncbi:unnamed protein product [Rodentolepis nana]|uniref:Reverse transcriptase domain-containing protein n=1 Tax=Rodentolepis nana TaxID=102285 RepID=A0A0R3TNV9_RODNA|nr:unnamed protein product [Rodentolepis nana]